MKVITFKHNWLESLGLGAFLALAFILLTSVLLRPVYPAAVFLGAVLILTVVFASLVRAFLPGKLKYSQQKVVLSVCGFPATFLTEEILLVAMTTDGTHLYFQIDGNPRRPLVKYRPELDEYLAFLNRSRDELEFEINLKGWEVAKERHRNSASRK